MAEIVNEAVIRVTADASGVEAGLRPVEATVNKTGKSLENLGETAAKTGKRLQELGSTPGMQSAGEGVDKAAVKVDRSAKSMADAIQRATATMEAGRKGSVEYYKALANQRGIDVKALQPFLDQLDSVTKKTEAAAEAQRKLDESTKFLADLRSRADGIGKTASQLAEMRAAQMGVSEAAAPMIARMREAESAASGLGRTGSFVSNALKGISIAAVAAVVIKLAHDTLAAQREFDKLNSSLITATGSAANAAKVFDAIQGFAATTPYSVQEATEAFIQMKNLGLDPSERALRSYGNTSAAMSKSLNQMVEAVADAATGEFERLKEFGIRAQKNGDQVAFTFKGITTIVGDSADEIQGYLIKLGETDFAGGMELRAKTLDGAISNLGDTWESVLRTIASNGIGDVMLSGVQDVTAALSDLKAILDAVGGAASREGQAAKEAGNLHKFLTTAFEAITVLGVNVAYVLEQVWKEATGIATQAVAIAHADLKGAIAIGQQMRKEAEEARRAVDAKSEAILGAAAEAQKADAEAAAARKKNGTDALAGYKTEISAAEQSAQAAQALVEVRQRLTGVDKQYLSDLSKLQDAREKSVALEKDLKAQLDSGKITTAKYNEQMKAVAITEKDYIALVTKLATETYKKSDAGKDATEAAKKEADAYKGLVESVKEKIAASSAEAAGRAALTESQKLQVSLDEQLASGKLKLTAAHKAEYEALIKRLGVNEAVIASNKRAKAAGEDFAKMMKEWNDAADKKIEDAVKEADANERLAETFGMTKKAIAELEIARLEEQLAQRGAGAFYLDEIEKLEKLIDAKKRSAAALGNVETKEANKKAFDQMVEDAKRSSEQISQSLTDNIMRGGKSAADYLKDLFRTLVLRPILSPIGDVFGSTMTSMFGPVGTAGASMMGGSAGGNSAISAAQTASAVYKVLTGGLESIGTTVADAVQVAMYKAGLTQQVASNGAVATAIGGAATIGSGVMAGLFGGKLISGQYGSNATVNTGTVGGGVLGGIATMGSPLGIAIGSAIGGLVGGITNRLFGMGNKEVTGQGISGTLSASSLAGHSYTNWHQDGGWFRSDKNGTDTTALTDAIVKQFTQGLAAIESASSNFASSLGVQADWIKDYSKVFDLKLTGDATKDQQVITDFFQGIGDEIAKKLVPNLDDLSKSGETASAALERLANDFKGTDQVAQLLGFSASQLFGTAGLDSAKAREQLIDMAGGLQVLSQYASTFNQNFLTDAERIKPVAEALDKALASLGLSTIPTTRDEFKSLVNDLIISGAAATESGAKQLDSLLALAEAFAQVHPAADAAAEAVDKATEALQAVKDAASTMFAGVNDAYSALQKVVSREKSVVQSSIDTHTAAFNKLQSLSQALHSTLDSLKSPDQKAFERTVAQAQIRAALAIAKAGGPLPDSDSLKDALSAVTQDASSQFSSYADYMRDLLQTQNDVAQLAGLTDDSLSVEQRSLDALKDQLARLDDIVANGQAQLDALNGQSIATLSLAQAMAAFQSSITSAQTNPVVAGTSSIASMYLELLGRTPDQAGLQYWQDALARGNQLDAIRSGIMESDEYKRLHSIPGFALGGMFGGGLRIVGENGPELEATGPSRIWSSNQTAALLARASGGDNSALIAEIRLLRETVAKQQAALDKIEQSTRRNADMFENATAGGNAPMLVEIA